MSTQSWKLTRRLDRVDHDAMEGDPGVRAPYTHTNAVTQSLLNATVELLRDRQWIRILIMNDHEHGPT